MGLSDSGVLDGKREDGKRESTNPPALFFDKLHQRLPTNSWKAKKLNGLDRTPSPACRRRAGERDGEGKLLKACTSALNALRVMGSACPCTECRTDTLENCVAK